MKRLKLLLLTLISVFVLISCSSAPITGRQQLKFVDDEKLASESSAAYSEFIAQVKQQNLLANNTNDGKKVTAVGNKLAVAVEKYLRENGQAQKVDYLNNLQIKTSHPEGYNIPAFPYPLVSQDIPEAVFHIFGSRNYGTLTSYIMLCPAIYLQYQFFPNQ